MVNNDEIKDICTILQDEKLVLCPTDTIWGISCNVLSESAVKRIYNIKNREIGKPFILLVSDVDMLKRYVKSIHPRIETLLRHHSKPLTIIYNNPKNIPTYALAQDGSVGIRIVQDEYCQRIITSLDAPLVSTSANYSGYNAPKNFSEIDEKLIAEVDYASKHRISESKLYVPSVIIKYDDEGQIEILRP